MTGSQPETSKHLVSSVFRAKQLRSLATKQGEPTKHAQGEVMNAALRVGLDQLLMLPRAKPYRTQPRPMGLRQDFSYDNVAELIARTEGEDHQ